MNRIWIIFGLSLLFAVVGFLILLDQYLMAGIWFEIEDLHHETFALASFTMTIGILIGVVTQKSKANCEK